MDTDLASPDDLAAIVRAARIRLHFLRWLAGRLRSSPDEGYRAEAAHVLEWFCEGGLCE